jgi:hypothetical protein
VKPTHAKPSPMLTGSGPPPRKLSDSGASPLNKKPWHGRRVKRAHARESPGKQMLDAQYRKATLDAYDAKLASWHQGTARPTPTEANTFDEHASRPDALTV